MAEFKSLKYFLTKLPTTPAHLYSEVYTDLFALFNSFRKLLSDLDEALLDYLTDAPEDGKTYGRKDGEWTEVTGGGGGSGIVETVVAGTGISVDDTDPANPVVSSTVNPFVEAPEDGQLYGRKDADWEVVTIPTVEWGDIAGTLSDQTDLASALSGKEPTITAGTTAQYWRGDKTWQTLPSPGISDAPNDGNEYVRKNAAWAVASGGGGGGGGGGKYMYPIDTPPSSPDSWNDEFDSGSLSGSWTQYIRAPSVQGSLVSADAYTVYQTGGQVGGSYIGIEKAFSGDGTYQVCLEYSTGGVEGPLVAVGNAANNLFHGVTLNYSGGFAGNIQVNYFAETNIKTADITYQPSYFFTVGTRFYVQIRITSSGTYFDVSSDGRYFSPVYLISYPQATIVASKIYLGLTVSSGGTEPQRMGSASVLWARKVA